MSVDGQVVAGLAGLLGCGVPGKGSLSSSAFSAFARRAARGELVLPHFSHAQSCSERHVFVTFLTTFFLSVPARPARPARHGAPGLAVAALCPASGTCVFATETLLSPKGNDPIQQGKAAIASALAVAEFLQLAQQGQETKQTLGYEKMEPQVTAPRHPRGSGALEG